MRISRSFISGLILIAFTIFPISTVLAGGVINLPQTGQTKCYDTAITNLPEKTIDPSFPAHIPLSQCVAPALNRNTAGASRETAGRAPVLEMTGSIAQKPSFKSAPTQYVNRSVPSSDEIRRASSKRTLTFIENQGQVDEKVEYYAKIAQGTIWFTKDEVVFDLLGPRRGAKHVSENIQGERGSAQDRHVTRSVVRMRLQDRDSRLMIFGKKKTDVPASYFKGNDASQWKTLVPAYEEVYYKNAYDGIDMRFYTSGNGELEYDFIVNPGADPQQIAVAVQGIDGMTVGPDGDLVMSTTLGEIRKWAPQIYQVVDGKRVEMAGGFEDKTREMWNRLPHEPDGVFTFGFSMLEYDKRIPLVIDPLVSSTFVGGSGSDEIKALVRDSSGNIFVAGNTGSPDYPTTSGAYDTVRSSYQDVFVSKFDANLTTLMASTFIGGTGSNEVVSIAIDSAGYVFIMGSTNSADYPTTPGSYMTSNRTGGIFISKLDNSLSTLRSSALIQGSVSESATSIAIDPLDNVFVVGNTGSPDYPTTPGAYAATSNGQPDLFISKFNNSLSSLMSSTFLGGSSSEEVRGFQLDPLGSVFVTGYTASTDYPTTSGVFDTSHNGSIDAFVSKLDNSLSSLLASTLVGGFDSDDAQAIALDSSGRVFIAGVTLSSDYPVTDGAYDTTYDYGGFGGVGHEDYFVSKLSGDLTQLEASTFLGGACDCWGCSDWQPKNIKAISIDRATDTVVILGNAWCYDMPVTSGAYDFQGRTPYVAKMDRSLSTVVGATYIGGGGQSLLYEQANAMAVDSSGNITIAGRTCFPSFPVTATAYDKASNAQCSWWWGYFLPDAFVSTITADLSCDKLTFTGTVKDSATGKPFSNVDITIVGAKESYTTKTDSNGDYSVPNVCERAYVLSVSIGDYSPYYRSINVGSSGTPGSGSLNIVLTRASATYGSKTPSGYGPDPVNTATGNYVYNKKDLEIPGRGVPFVFERQYNSQDSVDGPLGFGWNHTYNVGLTVNADSTVTIRWGDGKTETWTPDGSGGYTPQYGVFDTLLKNLDGTYTLKKRDLVRYAFDTSGKLTNIIDRNDNAITLSYTGANLTQITDTAARNIAFAYDGSNHITVITDPIGRTLQFTYDAGGNLATAKDMNGNTTTYTYDAGHQLLTVVDPRGNTVVTNVYDAQKRVVTSQRDAKGGQTTYTYDDANGKTTITNALGYGSLHFHDDLLRLIQETDALGNSAFYTYDASGNRTQVKDKRGNATTYAYDASGNVLTKTDALGNVTTISYDPNNNPLTRRDALGNITTFEYDAKGNPTKTTDPLSTVTTVAYNAYGRPLTVRDGRGNLTTNTYNPQGNLIQVTDMLDYKTTYTYDGVGRRLSIKDADDRTTTYTYDNNGNLLTATNSLGEAVINTYDGNNNRLTQKDPKGYVTSYAYDVKDLLTTITDPLNNTIVYTYDGLDRRTSAKDKRGNTTAFSYDAAGNLLTATDALGNTTSFTYDPNGNKLTDTNPLGRATTYAYDALNRMTSVKDPLNNTTASTYDGLGRITATTNPKGQTTEFQYDAMGRLIKVTDANGGAIVYSYDANGNRLTMTDPNGKVTSYIYDVLNRMTKKTEPLGGSYAYTYEAVGTLMTRKDPKGNTIGYTYDNANRLASTTYPPDGFNFWFSYDANGNRTQMTDFLGTSVYVYDSLNRMTSYTNPYGKTLGYGYDANGNKVSLTYPDGKVVSYEYDNVDRLTKVTDWLSRTATYTYDAAGSLIGATSPNGTIAAYTYDNAERLTALANKKSDNALISSYSYALDGIGNHLSVTQNEPLAPVHQKKTVAYTYDDENRLKSTGDITFTYDANGNITGLNGPGNQTYTNAFDYNDRLAGSGMGGLSAQYGYDGTGNRLSKTAGGAATRYVVDVNRSLPAMIAETTSGGAITAYYVYGNGLAWKVQSDGTVYYYHFDSRGSTVALTDASQNITAAYAYDTYGNVANKSGTAVNSFRYLGRHGVMDEDNGLYYARARYYAPEFGRFITKDPLTGKDGDSQNLNRYVYALNNPVRLIDISGLSANEGRVLGASTESSDKTHNRMVSHTNSDNTFSKFFGYGLDALEVVCGYLSGQDCGIGFLKTYGYEIPNAVADITEQWAPVLKDVREVKKGNTPQTWGGSTYKVAECLNNPNAENCPF